MLQEDDMWCDLEMAPGVTVGEAGCLVLCICRANWYLGNDLTPDVLVPQLRRTGGFKPNGELIWRELRHTNSWIWQRMHKAPAIRGLRLVQYTNFRGGHFILQMDDRTYNPAPRTPVFLLKSIREFAWIPRRRKAR